MQNDVEAGLPPRRSRFGFGAGVVAGVLAAGVAAVLIVATLGAAGAQTPTPTPSQRLPGKGFGHLGHGFGGFGGALHGEFTVPGPNGGYQTMAMQTGTVTAVRSSSLTVKSADGYSKTYVVDGNTLVDAGQNGIGSVKNGDTVHVLAIVSGSTARAVRVEDATNIRNLEGRWRPMRPMRPKETQPSPGSSPATFSQTSYSIGA
jgi:hypothetical protein